MADPLIWWRRLPWPARSAPSPGPRGAATAGETSGSPYRLDVRTRRLVDSLFPGDHPSIFAGRGAELAQIREYQFGDDIRSIDWRVTARTGRTHVRSLMEERDLLLYLVVDLSASVRLAPTHLGGSTVGVVETIVATIAHAAVRSNDRVGLLLLTDRVEALVPPRSGRRQALRILDRLASHPPQGGHTDLSAGLVPLLKRLPGRALILLLSDFVGLGGDRELKRTLHQLSRQHHLVALRLCGKGMDELPQVGLLRVTDPETGRGTTVDTNSPGVRARFRETVLHSREQLRTLVVEGGGELLEIDLAKDPVEPLVRWLRQRRGDR